MERGKKGPRPTLAATVRGGVRPVPLFWKRERRL